MTVIDKNTNEKVEILDTAKIAENTEMIREAFNYVTTKRQLDLIYAIISLVHVNDNQFTEYIIPYREIAKLYNPANPDSNEIKKYVEEATNKIMDSHFSIRKNERIYKYHWVDMCYIDDKEKVISFKLKDEVRNMYLNLKENTHTVYLLNDLLSLSTLFQANLFRWLSCNSNFSNDIPITINNAKQMFYGGEIETSSFIRKLDSAINAINKKTKLTVSYKKIRNSQHQISTLSFNIKNNYNSAKAETKTIKGTKKQSAQSKIKELYTENKILRYENEVQLEVREEYNQLLKQQQEKINYIEETIKQKDDTIDRLENMVKTLIDIKK